MGSGSTLCRGVGARFSLIAIAGAALLCAASFPACLPDAEGDYNDFRRDTESVRGKKVIDYPDSSGGAGGATDGCAATTGLPDASGTYHVTCLPSIGNGDPGQALRFVGKIVVTKDTPESATGKVTVGLTPLLKDATSLTETVGVEFSTATPVDFTAGEASTLPFGSGVSVPGLANPISGSEILLNDARMVARVKTCSFLCAELDGQAVKPLNIDLAAADSIDVCLFDRVPDGTVTVARVTEVNRFVPCK